MTDTTEQQAVTVAQDDRGLAAVLFPTYAASILAGDMDESENVQAIARYRHRLASVSSASAGYTIEQGQPAATAPYACCVLAGRFVEDIGEWEMAVVSTPLVKPFTHWWPLPSSEPVPATNQAGEVDVDQLADDYAAEYVMSTEGNDYVPTDWERELIIDALHGFIADHWNAAAPTPPTLSEDLREVVKDLERAVARILPGCVDDRIYRTASGKWAKVREEDLRSLAAVHANFPAALTRAQAKAS